MDLSNLGSKFSIFGHKLDRWVTYPTCDQTFLYSVVSWIKGDLFRLQPNFSIFGHELERGLVEQMIKIGNI